MITFTLAKSKTNIIPPWGARVPTASAKVTSSSISISIVASGSWLEEHTLETYLGKKPNLVWFLALGWADLPQAPIAFTVRFLVEVFCSILLKLYVILYSFLLVLVLY